MKARAHRSRTRHRVIRTAKQGNARDAIGAITPGCEIVALTYGQFSFIDALAHVCEEIGAAELTLSTWTAADADLTVAARLVEGMRITRLRFIVDRSFLTRQPAYCRKMVDLFGLDCIRTMRSHAKFSVVKNERFNLAIRTSMNLNTNPRLEIIEISDDPALAAFLETVADDLFREQAPGEFAGEFPELASLENVNRPGVVQAGKAAPGRRPSVGRIG